MSQISSLIIERFKRLPQRSGECWQGGLLRLPTRVEEGPGSRPYRPWAAVWVSLATGLVNVKMEPKQGARDFTLALEALLEFGLKGSLAGCRPGSIEVADEDLGARLLEALGDREIRLTVVPDLHHAKAMLAEMSRQIEGVPLHPDALDAKGVTVERMRAFAEAAKRFYEAGPWRHLSDEDLIRVQTPVAEPGLRHMVVLGAAGQTFGLGFFHSEEEHDELQYGEDPEVFLEGPRWSVFFGPIWEMPFGDADLWEDHALPVAGENAYPVAIRLGPGETLQRPDAAVLSYLEGLLLALGESTEDEIDRGRWTRQVGTHEGPATFQLCIPFLLEPLDARRAGLPDRRMMERVMAEAERLIERSEFKSAKQANKALQRLFSGPLDAIPSTATTPIEKAQELVYQAFEARGRRRVQLARKALELSPDCADAYVLLAEHSGDLKQACDLYAQGVAAGERALGPRTFEDNAGHFWGLIHTRPYMRARLGLAQCLELLGATDEAIGHYQEILRLNPNDNQGVRDLLLPALLAAGRDKEAGELLRQYEKDASAPWQYGWALWSFRQEGDSRAARERLREAVKTNRRVPKYLTGAVELPDIDPPSYAFGSEEEAVLCARELADLWQATPDAERWLRSHASAGKSRKRRRR